MNPPKPTEPGIPSPRGDPVFATTRWSAVLSAQSHDAPDSRQALEDLCRAYWYPLYAHVRRLGYSPCDAEDLTQGFFASLLAKGWLAAADRERGRFRSFLLGSLRHFLANDWDRARAKKRGGHVQVVSLGASDGEQRLLHEPITARTPEQDFDRRWALKLLETVLDRLGREYEQEGKAKVFAGLKSMLGGERSGADQKTLARDLGMSEGAVRVAAHRLRRRYRELLRDEIAQTVATQTEVDDEMRHLLAVLSQ